MDLNDLILSNNKWSVKGNFLMFKKLQNIPVCYIEDDIIYIFLDAKIPKEIIRFTKSLINKNLCFYFTTPQASNPKGVENLKYEILYHYLLSYANSAFFYGFRKIDFDLIDNMVKWSEYSNTFHLVKSAFQAVNKRVQSKEWYPFTNIKHYNYNEEIREDFNSLYRHIQISKII